MPKTGIRSYQTKNYGRRWLAYYSRDGKQGLHPPPRTGSVLRVDGPIFFRHCQDVI